MTSELTQGYTVEIDSVDKDVWNSLLMTFHDANIYQTWSYEAIKSSEQNLSHMLLRNKGEVVAAAQARIAKLPFTNIGVAYIRWGPLWQTDGRASDREVFAQAIRALRNEYSCRRGLVTRILPVLYSDQAEDFTPILGEEGFVQSPVDVPQRTLLVNLERPVEELRKGLEQKWRNCLNRAEKNNLRIVEGVDDDLFGLFSDIYRQTHSRKKFQERSDIHHFQKMQKDLPHPLKMKILIAFSDDEPAAGIICSCIGKTGVYLFGGTSNNGLTTKGSYLLQWRVLNWLKEQEASRYDLHGINYLKNPGTSHFKAGLCGRNGQEVSLLGVYDACDCKILRKLFQCADAARIMYRRGKTTLNGLRKKLHDKERKPIC